MGYFCCFHFFTYFLCFLGRIQQKTVGRKKKNMYLCRKEKTRIINKRKTMNINIIAAVAENRAIGFENKLLYWLPDDLKRFKALTTGHTIIMGRKTFESLPKGALPNRRNIVLSRNITELPGCEVFPSLSAALEKCGEEEEVYIIGGSTVYAEGIAIASRLCLTEIHDTPSSADAFFPDYSAWREVWREEHYKDEKHSQNFSFVDDERV